MKEAIIIRYCEIHLKGKNRGYFEKLLKDNIKKTLKDLEFNFTALHSRYLIEDYDQNDYGIITERLKKIAGIHTYSRAIVVNNDLEEIFSACKTLCEGKKGAFKVETNRADKTFEPNSVETSRLLGGRLLELFGENISVNLKEPSFTINVDIREDGKTFIYDEIVHCMSGMPVGSAGRGLLLISGGIDSPVAGYLTMKRGMKIDCLHFHSFPYTGEAAKEKVVELTKKIGVYNGGINLYVVSFTHIQEAIHKNCPEEYMITLMRRFMMRIAERLSVKIGTQAIITGESLGQVASQTVESMTVTNAVVEDLPIFRPLISFDKEDITKISKNIGAYETSILPYEDCCTVFLPKYPSIKPNLERVIKAENKLDVEALIEKAFENFELISL